MQKDNQHWVKSNGTCPDTGSRLVTVKFRNGEVSQRPDSGTWDWSLPDEKNDWDIVAYCVEVNEEFASSIRMDAAQTELLLKNVISCAVASQRAGGDVKSLVELAMPFLQVMSRNGVTIAYKHEY